MSWPPSSAAGGTQNGFIGSGYTTIRWGTDGIAANITPNGNGGGYAGFYIVESIRGNDEIENIYIEQGTGLKATRIQLWQGRRYVATVVDDTSMFPPSAGSQVSWVDSMSGGGTIYLFTVVDNGYNAARKVEGKREITAEYLTCIEGGGTPPVI